ncbi:hypothetical protein FHG55_06040 [Pseudomonas jessenii]|uniref:Uncharacterized protein n=1 Tax=Pseudomonas jessenii TaxID=77298 RepID=A0A5C4L3P7_PSEJE|nr:hypothetical protein [Pseudomonas jessenii]TNB98596.1 hypothetical protein FHG55_06040 [Pseudomonas jessenii]
MYMTRACLKLLVPWRTALSFGWYGLTAACREDWQGSLADVRFWPKAAAQKKRVRPLLIHPFNRFKKTCLKTLAFVDVSYEEMGRA